MALEVCQNRLPIHWRIGERECKGLALTQIAALPDGIYELIKLQRWSAKRENLKFVHDMLTAALTQEHLKTEYDAALKRYQARGKKIGKARAETKRREYVQLERNVEFGLIS